MNVMNVHGTEIDSCPKCGGVFLDASEGGVINVDTQMLFGFGARPVGESRRVCPDHDKPMTIFSVATPGGNDIEIERSGCCGGIYLDAGEGIAMAQPASRVRPEDRAALSCPACASKLVLKPFHEVTVDECDACGSFFLGPGEAEHSNIDTEALFDDAPWAASRQGASELSCPECDKPMVHYESELLGTVVEVHFAECCGGVWMKRDAENAIRAASRFAVGERADAQFTAGEPVQQSAATLTKKELEDRRLAGERYRATAVAHQRDRMLFSMIRAYQHR